MGTADFGGAAMTDEQVVAVGDEFARSYYAALVAGPAALRGFYGSRSDHLFLVRGRADVAARGPDDVQRFAARMAFDRSEVRVQSVDTIRVRANRFVVLTVGEMMCPWPGRPAAEVRKFVQSTVVRRSACGKFSIVGTVFMFDDAITELPNDDGALEDNCCTDDVVDKPKTPPPSPSPTLAADLQALPSPLPPPPENISRNRCTANAESVHVTRLPDGVGADELWTEFGRFGRVIGVDVHQGSRRKRRSAKSRHGFVWYERDGTADVVVQCGTVTLANGDVVTVESSPGVLPSPRFPRPNRCT